ncbi:MAG: hemerythrin family protein [Lachnospiraceae bacterium]|nr:hemerythrin family protein [Lachnospiraceae bacterium]
MGDEQGIMIKWDHKYSLGVEEVDQEHKKLFSIIHKIVELSEKGEDSRAQHACREGVKYFKNYTISHFAHEEEFMESLNYGGYERHKKIHDDLKNHVLPAMEKELEENDYSPETVRHFLGICTAWLVTHIKGEDQAIMNRRTGQQMDLKISSQEAMFEKILKKLLDEMYELEIEAISNHYAGWDFGKAIFHELTFVGKNKEVTHLMFALEQELIFALAGQSLGLEIKRIDSFLLGAVKEILFSLSEQISFYMNLDGECKSRSGVMLSTSDIQDIFQHKTILYSTLFNTPMGHFACCVYRR